MNGQTSQSHCGGHSISIGVPNTGVCQCEVCPCCGKLRKPRYKISPYTSSQYGTSYTK